MHASARRTIFPLLAVGVILCVVILGGCGGSDDHATTGGVSGQAIWSDGSGAAHVQLTFTDASVTPNRIYSTDCSTAGAYSVGTMVPGTYNVTSVTLDAPAGNARPVEPATVTITAGQTLTQLLTIQVPPAGP